MHKPRIKGRELIAFNFSGKLKSIEVLGEKSYSILTKQGELHTENWKTNIKDEFKHPIIRRIDDDSVLIVETRVKENNENAKVFNKNGELTNSFYIGDAVNDVIVYERKLVVSYFDEGVMAQKKYSKEGLALFNKKGIMKWGFNSNSKFEIWDCYQIVKTGHNKVLFFGYGKLPVCELDIDFLKVEEVAIPIEPYVDSVSSKDNKLYWKNSTSVFCFDRELKELKQVRKFSKRDRRALLDDTMITISKDGYQLEKLIKQI